ncbi:peptidylprolyl isomerase [Reinekea marina]|uniref:Peptidyl-prolyl cis-trans isomerase n=1 Tax=Reinekea marina TaxID=1310421 RepID=A0ABV7WTB8_9GAMM|nr:peptidylprolyl isomerase [Reinekea marina]MDN3649058.1 peptidylprolyl isomerase [Reinekea marina]
MNISKDTVVEMHYTLSEAGKQIESSFDTDPLVYLHGHSGMLEGVEAALEGKAAGDKIEVTLSPEKAYGEIKENAIQRIPLKHLQGAKKWKAGMTAIVESNQGRKQVTLVKVGKFNADCDLNHPLAGKTLDFSIEILNVRAAEPEEVAHGHVHGKGGHHH